MPYIKTKDRDRFEPELSTMTRAKTPGEMNYLFTEIIDRYMIYNGLNYQTINDIVGALEGAKLEFYRRVAAPYEETKITINGDVYTDVFVEEPNAKS